MLHTKLKEQINKLGFSVWVENIDPNDPSFALLRMKGFGASDSALLLDVSPFGTIDRLMQEKKHHIVDETIGKKASVRKGKDLEDLLIYKVSAITGREIIKPNDMYGDDEAGLTVNFDGVSMENGVLIPDEIKVCTFFGRRYYDFTKSILEDGVETIKKPHNDVGPYDETLEANQDDIESLAKSYGIPVYYFTQLQQQMYFLDAPYGYLNVMDDHNWTLHIFKIYRHQYVIDKLVEIAKMKYLELRVFRGEIKEDYENF